MGLRDSIASDAKSVFCNNTEFAEQVTYNFAAGGSRSFAAMIDRDQPEVYDPNGQVVLAKYVVTMPNACVDGVKDSEVDTGGDSITLKKEFGDIATETVLVTALLTKDLGMIQVALI